MSPAFRPRRASRMPGPVLAFGGTRTAGGRRSALVLVLAVFCLAGAARAAPPDQAWIKPKAEQSLLIDIAHDRGRWVVVGERGHVLVSDDAEKWRQVSVPTRVTLTAVDMKDGGGFAVGHDATIIRTRDNGDSWEQVYRNPEEQAPFLDVVVVNADRAVAVGAYGLYAETTNGGETWEQGVLEPRELDAAQSDEEDDEEDFYYDFHLNDIAVAGNGRWYIAAEAGTVYRSDDQGETWLRLPSPYEGSFFGVLPLSGDNVLLFGLQGRLYRSADAGINWRRIETGVGATLSSGLPLGDDEALITGYAGVVLNEVDTAGNLKRATLDNRPALSGAFRLENGNLLTVGEGGVRQWSADVVSGR